MTNTAQADGLPPEASSFEISVTRHAKDALSQRSLTMLDLVDALRAAPDKVRQDPQSGHYVIRDRGSRFVFQIDPADRTATAITVAGPEY